MLLCACAMMCDLTGNHVRIQYFCATTRPTTVMGNVTTARHISVALESSLGFECLV